MLPRALSVASVLISAEGLAFERSATRFEAKAGNATKSNPDGLWATDVELEELITKSSVDRKNYTERGHFPWNVNDLVETLESLESANQLTTKTKQGVCVGVPVFEETHWVDGLLSNFLKYAAPETKLAVHLDLDDAWTEDDVKRWTKMSKQIIINPERIFVKKWYGSILWSYVMNALFLEKTFPGHCSHFVLQESNQFWVRSGMEEAVVRQNAVASSWYPCYGDGNKDVTEHPFFQQITNFKIENMAWAAPEGYFLPMRNMLDFCKDVLKYVDDNGGDAHELIIDRQGHIEEFWLPTYIRARTHVKEPEDYKCINQRDLSFPGASVEKIQYVQENEDKFSVKRIARDWKDPGTRYIFNNCI